MDDRFKMIDPACGSGHFLLGSFARLVDAGGDASRGRTTAVLAQRALDGVHGVDLNPYAVAIARFRLLAGGAQGGRHRAAGRAPTSRQRGLRRLPPPRQPGRRPE